MDTERLIELDVLRAFAIIGVILLHVVSGALYVFSPSSLSFKTYLSLDQFLRFCVPLFVCLSGYTLALRYKDKKLEIDEFFKRRVIRLLPWYFFWSAIIFLYLRFTHWWAEAPKFPLWKVIFLGKVDYHLYFVPMIFQLYLLFPVLLFLFKKFRTRFLLVVFALQISFYYFLSLTSLEKIDFFALKGDQQQYLFAGTWIFYFVLGIALSTSAKFPNWAKKAFMSFAVINFIWIFGNSLNLVHAHKSLNVVTRSTRIPVLLYATSFSMFALAYADKILLLRGSLIKVLANLGKRSYVIYLLHTLVLRVFSDVIHFRGSWNIALIAILTIVTSDYLAQVSISASNLILGKLRKNQKS